SSHRPPSPSISVVAVSRSSTIRSRGSRFLPDLLSGTCWKPTVRPSSVRDSTTNWPSPIVVSTCTLSSAHQNGASRCGSVVSTTRYPTEAGIMPPGADCFAWLKKVSQHGGGAGGAVGGDGLVVDVAADFGGDGDG